MKTCFVVAPIGDEGTEVRRRSDVVLKYIIAPAAEHCGYTPLRADQMAAPGLITSQVIEQVINAPLVIADLTGRNPNVFYELALRYATRKPLVQLIKKGEPIPFDVAATRTIVFDHNDLESADEAKRQIVRQIKTIESTSGSIDTPISLAVDLQFLRQSDDPEQRSVGDLLSQIQTELAVFRQEAYRWEVSRVEDYIGPVVARAVLEVRDVSEKILVNMHELLKNVVDEIREAANSQVAKKMPSSPNPGAAPDS